MKPLRFIHAADFHLDAPFRGGRAGYGQTRRGDVRAAFTRTIEQALSGHADLLLLCGDLFEQDGVTRDTLTFLTEAFNRLEATQVVLLPGNHDPLSADSWYHAVVWPPHVHVLQVCGTTAATLCLPELDTHVAGFGFSQMRQDTPDFSSLPRPVDGGYHVLMLHGTLDGPPGSGLYHPVTEAQLRATGYHYVAMGHYHNAFERPGTPHVANPGSPEPLGFDEPGVHGVIAGTLRREPDGVRVEIRQVPVATREYVTMDVDVSAAAGMEEMRFALVEALHAYSPERFLPHVRLVGTPAEPPDLQALAAWFDDGWLLCRMSDATRPPMRLDRLHPESLSGVFARLMAAQLAEVSAATPVEGTVGTSAGTPEGMSAVTPAGMPEGMPAVTSAGMPAETAAVADAERLTVLRNALLMGYEALAYGEVHLRPEQQGGG